MDPRQVFLAFERTPEAFTQIPGATYRLQLHRGFTFRDAQATVPYLAALGISHCYLSPLLLTATDSSHGYDVADHNQFSPALGTEADYLAFAEESRRHGMGHIADVVPNHMGIAGTRNAWWLDVLENGPASPYAAYFDIEWDPVKPEMRNKVLLPILGDQYGNALENQELRLAFADGAFAVCYFDTRLPIDPSTSLAILRLRLDELEAELGPPHPQLLELQSIITALTHLPSRTETDSERQAERQRERQVIRQRLGRLAAESPAVRAFIETNLTTFNGTKGQPESFALLDRLLNAQAYRLASWQVAGDEINYRRFFDVNDLAAIRMEEPAVFAHAHALLLRLVRGGWITGLRIDHPDGLYAPAQYFAQLQRRCFLERAAAVAGAAGGGDDPSWRQAVLAEYDRRLARLPHGPLARSFYVIAEKILTDGEEPPAHWSIHGTTGYEFLNALNGLFVDPDGARAFDQIYAGFLGAKDRFSRIVYESKKLVMDTSMASELSLLGHRLARISERHRASRDFTDRSLTGALREIIACFPVYRTYVGEDDGEATERERRAIERATAVAQRLNPTTSPSIFAFIRDLLARRGPEPASAAERAARVAFVGQFQQLTGPVTAKGVEDTAFYRYHRLISLNEVGGNPARFGVTPEEFDRLAAARRAAWPASLSATSTHDTKRSEDVRARINALSEIPRQWRLRVRQWHRLNRHAVSTVDGQSAPDRGEEYLLYQTLLGAWPLEPPGGGEYGEFVKRIQRYMFKALREAKIHVSWVNPRPDYDAAIERFVATILKVSPDNHFLADFLPFQRQIAEWGMYTSLAQTLVKLTAPGVPDLYQGTELWDLSLVDPDNRRPVDYDRRREMLRALDADVVTAGSNLAVFARTLTTTKEDGRIKLYAIRRALACRRERPALFLQGEYVPLTTGGSRRRHLFAFARRLGSTSTLTIVPRLLARLCPASPPLGREVWTDTWIALPDAVSARRFRNAFTGEIIETTERGGAAVLAAARVLDHFPIALLEAVPEGWRGWTQWLRPVLSRLRRGEPEPVPEPAAGAGQELEHFVETRLPALLPVQRWFGSKGRHIAAASLTDVALFEDDGSRAALAFVEVAFDTGPAELYAVPLAFRGGDPETTPALGTLELEGRAAQVIDAFDDENFCRGLLEAFAREATVPSRHGALRFTRTAGFPALPGGARVPARRVGAEQSNTSVAYGDTLVLKIFRKVIPGTNLDYEMSEFLTARMAFPNVPALAGALHYTGPGGLEATLAMLQRFVPNQGDGWAYVVNHLRALLDFLAQRVDADPVTPARRGEIVREFSADFLGTLRRLGAVTGGLHAVLASDAVDPAFAPEPITSADVDRWIAEIAHDTGVTLAIVRERLDVIPAGAQRAARALLAAEADLMARLSGLAALTETGCHKIRIHGDYHLGQTLRTEADFMIIDFEGEPARPPAERRARRCPLKDVAGMMRSLDYAVAATLADAAPRRGQEHGALSAWGETWTDLAGTAFLEGYLEEATRAPVALLPATGPDVMRVLAVLILEKALYEVRYEMDNRPTWLPIPIDALRRLLARPAPSNARPREGGA